MRDLPWWQSAVIYEIYPRSFQDTDADGVGEGLEELGLEHLELVGAGHDL